MQQYFDDCISDKREKALKGSINNLYIDHNLQVNNIIFYYE